MFLLPEPVSYVHAKFVIFFDMSHAYQNIRPGHALIEITRSFFQRVALHLLLGVTYRLYF